MWGRLVEIARGQRSEARSRAETLRRLGFPKMAKVLEERLGEPGER